MNERNTHAGRRRNHIRSMSGWHKTGCASVIFVRLTSDQKIAHSPKKCLENKIAHKICSQRANLLWAKICSINLLTENLICSRRINFAHGESWITVHSTCNPSMASLYVFYLQIFCSRQRKFAHNKEKLPTKIEFAQSKNLLTEFARNIEKLLMMKTLPARMDQHNG